MEKEKEKKDKKSSTAEKVLGGGGKKHDSKKKKKPRFKHTHIEHHDDGSHTIRHTPATTGPEGKPGEEMSYSRPDMEGLHAGLDENLAGQGEPMESPGGGAGGAMAALGGAGAPQA